MFKIKSNKEIGEYLSKLINENFPSVRQFGAECLKICNKEINDKSL